MADSFFPRDGKLPTNLFFKEKGIVEHKLRLGLS